MGNVLGWFGLKKEPTTPKAARRESSPQSKSDSTKCQNLGQPPQTSSTSPTVHQSTLQVTLQPKPKDEDHQLQTTETKVPPKPEVPAVVSKPNTTTPEPPKKPEMPAVVSKPNITTTEPPKKPEIPVAVFKPNTTIPEPPKKPEIPAVVSKPNTTTPEPPKKPEILAAVSKPNIITPEPLKKPEIPAVVSKPNTTTPETPKKPDQQRPPERPPAPKVKPAQPPSIPIAVTSTVYQAQESVNSLANMAKEEVKNLTESISKTSVSSGGSTVMVTTSSSCTKTVVGGPTTATFTSTIVNQVKPTVVAVKETVDGKVQKTVDVIKEADPFEIVVVCPPCDEPTQCSEESTQHLADQDNVEDAVVKIQAGIRGYLTRKALKDRLSPAPGSLTEEQIEAAESLTESEIGNSALIPSLVKTHQAPDKTPSPGTKEKVTSAPLPQAPSSTAVEAGKAKGSTPSVDVPSTDKSPIKSTGPVKVELPGRPAEIVKPKPQPQITEAVTKVSQVTSSPVATKIQQQIIPDEWDEEDVEYEDEEDEEEEELLEDDEPTPPATPKTQLKKPVPTPSGAPSSGVSKKH